MPTKRDMFILLTTVALMAGCSVTKKRVTPLPEPPPLPPTDAVERSYRVSAGPLAAFVPPMKSWTLEWDWTPTLTNLNTTNNVTFNVYTSTVPQKASMRFWTNTAFEKHAHIKLTQPKLFFGVKSTNVLTGLESQW